MPSIKKLKISHTINLPAGIVQLVERSELKPTQKAKAFKFIGKILYKIASKQLEINDYWYLSSSYFRMVFKDGRHQIWLDELKKLKILQVKKTMDEKGNLKETYMVKNRKGAYPKAYRLNADLLTGNYVETKYEILQEVDTNEFVNINNEAWDVDILREDYRNLLLPRSEMMNLAKKIVNNINISNFKVNDAIENNYIARVINTATGYDGVSTRQKCLDEAKKHGMDFIKADTDKFYIKKIDDFIIDRRKNALISYTYAINNLCSGKFYFSRNGKNQRLNHNITSLHKDLTKFIMQENDLVEIDLCNSQWAILAYIMDNDVNFKKTPDFKIFKQEAATGTLYQYLARNLNLSLAEAKLTMMEVGFSSFKNNTVNKKHLKDLFPSVVKYIDDYKKQAADSSQFAILLQDFEANIFIDNIFNKLKRDGYFCLTKHDSLIVRKNDAEHILQSVKNYFTEIKFDCRFKTEQDASITTKSNIIPMNKLKVKEGQESDRMSYAERFTAPITVDESMYKMTWSAYREMMWKKFRKQADRHEWYRDCYVGIAS